MEHHISEQHLGARYTGEQKEPYNKSVSDTTCPVGMKGGFILFLGLALSLNHMYA